MTFSSYKLASLLCLSLLLNLGHASPNHNATVMNNENLESILIDSKQKLESAKILNNNDIKIASSESKTSEKLNIKQDIFSFPTINASRQMISDSKRYYASVKEDEAKVYSLSMRADGFIENLFVTQTYTKVKANQPLFSFYAPDIIDAQSELLATMSHPHIAEQKLLLLGVSPKEITKLKTMKKTINAVTFYAPFNGIVFTKNVNNGSGVKKGDEVFRIVDISTLWVIAQINQEDLEFIRQANNTAYVKIEGHDEKIAITLDRIYPNVIDNFVQARFILPNNNLLFFPNAFAQVIIESKPKERLVLPKNAVLFKNGRHFVFINDDGEFMPQEVQARRILGSELYEITYGLEENEAVIKNALFVVDSDAQNNDLF
ncbi:efflux RND transporter periplasmic adaptor subunit [Helicobacter muridarum]|uniref:Cation efflux system protein n=1 Tax=Helicobacter muridarum TaxID=216 RepID=A0A377PV24_9HELI|nr:HlyD family efflux transporter periplasmic adaptor subunit [Helicobacter muridarum]TLD99279.1 efflux RND transporter periplasmic adaptor subunit [Helicobacter muridarum]STQ86131.1 cation efflux system protein [Helicobacter muridarum]